jgi:hypothetical protein
MRFMLLAYKHRVILKFFYSYSHHTSFYLTKEKKNVFDRHQKNTMRFNSYTINSKLPLILNDDFFFYEDLYKVIIHLAYLSIHNTQII